MFKSFRGLFLALLTMGTSMGLLTLAAAAEVKPMGAVLGKGLGDNPEKFFGLVDKNGDKRISRVELRVHKLNVFIERDRDKNTKLSPMEFPINSTAFKDADKDGDGVLNGYEFTQADFAKFESLDGDRDGFISFEEFLAARKRLE